MHKKPTPPQADSQPSCASTSSPILGDLDFTLSQQQVARLMASVLHETSQNETKIRFIKELLHEQRYPINPKIIAHKMLEFTNVPLPELEPEA